MKLAATNEDGRYGMELRPGETLHLRTGDVVYEIYHSMEDGDIRPSVSISKAVDDGWRFLDVAKTEAI